MGYMAFFIIQLEVDLRFDDSILEKNWISNLMSE